jgi:ammonia channel protein AmtB
VQVCTGALAGLVAVTSGCCVVTPWAAIIAGTVAAPIYVYAEVRATDDRAQMVLRDRKQVSQPAPAVQP